MSLFLSGKTDLQVKLQPLNGPGKGSAKSINQVLAKQYYLVSDELMEAPKVFGISLENGNNNENLLSIDAEALNGNFPNIQSEHTTIFYCSKTIEYKTNQSALFTVQVTHDNIDYYKFVFESRNLVKIIEVTFYFL